MKGIRGILKKGMIVASMCILMASTCLGKDSVNIKNADILEIEHIKANGQYKDLLPLKGILSQADIIGMGEATHGNKEFFQMKHRVFEFLVKEMGIKNFAIEADFGGAQIVNDYILNNTGTAKGAVQALGFGIYKVQEMVDMITWMHDYNLTVEDVDKIHFYGFDMQRYDANKTIIFNYMNKVSGEKTKHLQSDLAFLNDKNMYNLEEMALKSGLVKVRAISNNLEDNKAIYIKRSSEREYQTILKHVDIITQNINHQLMGNKSVNRDAFMAKNVQWILEHEKKIGRGKLFISGHNGHIEKSSSGMYRCMGENLAKTYGKKYYAIGTEFYEGTFLCRDELSGERKNFTFKANQATSFGKLMNDQGIDTAFINFKIDKPYEFHMIGDSFSALHMMSKQYYTLTQVPSKAYDGIIFIKNITPATTLEISKE